jgi:hypothetical protein
LNEAPSGLSNVGSHIKDNPEISSAGKSLHIIHPAFVSGIALELRALFSAPAKVEPTKYFKPIRSVQLK